MDAQAEMIDIKKLHPMQYSTRKSLLDYAMPSARSSSAKASTSRPPTWSRSKEPAAVRSTSLTHAGRSRRS